MEKAKLIKLISLVIFIEVGGLPFGTGFCQTQTAFESYFLNINKYPVDATPVWHPYLNEIQGVTHDSVNWFITTTGPGCNSPLCLSHKNCWLWKIPVNEDLNNISPTTLHVNLWQFPTISTTDTNDGYTHWGGLDHYKYNGVDYLIIPSTSNELPSPAVLFFKASDLSFLGYAKLADQTDVGWCAINKQGILFTSPDQTYYINYYLINWNTVATGGYIGQNLIHPGYHILKAVNGIQYNSSNFLHNMQGGAFTSSGELLYLSNGSGYCDGIGDGQHENDGIHAFSTSIWTEIQHSFNDQQIGPSHYFNYHYWLGCDACFPNAGSWSPEGLTIWDLDQVPDHDPNVNGQLHVMLFHYQEFCDNEVTFYHFGNKIHVDQANGDSATWPTNWTNPFIGATAHPFNNFDSAYFWYPAWDGAEITLKAGSYPETGIYNKHIKINSTGGTATIGGTGK